MKKIILISALLFSFNGWAANDQPIATEEQLEPLVGFAPFQETLKPLTYVDILKEDIWIKPVMNLSASDRFRECYKLPEREEINALINTQVAFNEGGCKGIAFTNSGIYINNTGWSSMGSKTKGKFFIPYSILYDDATVYDYETSPDNFIVNDIEVSVLPDFDAEGLVLIRDSFELARTLSKRDEYRFVKEEDEEKREISDFPVELLSSWDDAKMERIYVKPNIPKKLEKQFRKCNKLSEDVQILTLIPAALLKSQACNGAALTNEGIFIKNAWMSESKGRHFLPYDVFLDSNFVPREYRWVIYLTPNLAIDYTGAPPDPDEVLNIFRSIRGDVLYSDDVIENAFKNKSSKQAAKDFLSFAIGLYIAKETVCEQPGKAPTINKALLGMNPEYRGGAKKHKSRVRRYNENVKKLKSDCERKRKKLALLGLLTQ